MNTGYVLCRTTLVQSGIIVGTNNSSTHLHKLCGKWLGEILKVVRPPTSERLFRPTLQTRSCCCIGTIIILFIYRKVNVAG